MDIEKQLGVVKAVSRDDYDLHLVMFHVEIKDSPVGIKDGHYFYLHVDFSECVINCAKTEQDVPVLIKTFKLTAC